MASTEAFLAWDVSPLGARAAMAMSRVLEPLNPPRSDELNAHAHDLAVILGEMALDPSQISPLISSDPELVKSFNYGCQCAAERAELLTAHPPAVWTGSWNMDLHGVFETRASVAQTEDGFLPGLEVSRLGGDCEPSHGAAVPTLDEAKRIALHHEHLWHSVRTSLLDGGT